MTFREWRYRFHINGLAAAYARAHHGVELPWRAGDDTPGAVVRTRGTAFLRLASTLARGGHMRALALLPAYAFARTFAYPRGLRDGTRRWAATEPAS